MEYSKIKKVLILKLYMFGFIPFSKYYLSNKKLQNIHVDSLQYFYLSDEISNLIFFFSRRNQVEKIQRQNSVIYE